MSKTKKAIIEVQGMPIAVLNQNDQDYVSLTDIARYRNSQEPFAIINNWMCGRSTVEFLGQWEKLSNPSFKPLEFERFRNEEAATTLSLSSTMDRSHPGHWHHLKIRPLRWHLRAQGYSL